MIQQNQRSISLKAYKFADLSIEVFASVRHLSFPFFIHSFFSFFLKILIITDYEVLLSIGNAIIEQFQVIRWIDDGFLLFNVLLNENILFNLPFDVKFSTVHKLFDFLSKNHKLYQQW